MYLVVIATGRTVFEHISRMNTHDCLRGLLSFQRGIGVYPAGFFRWDLLNLGSARVSATWCLQSQQFFQVVFCV